MKDKRIIKALNHFSDIVPLNLYISITSKRLIFPFCHNISNEEPEHTKNLFRTKNVREFEQDLDCLLKHFIPLDLSKLIEIIKTGSTNGKNYFWLSFDDGLREIYELAEPILKSKGVPYGIFINTAFIDNKDLFYRYKASILAARLDDGKITGTMTREVERILKEEKLFRKSIRQTIFSIRYYNRHLLDNIAIVLGVNFKEYLASRKPYLTSDQVTELARDNVSIGSHSIDHPKYSDISVREQLRQTRESLEFIKSRYNVSQRIFAFPFNDLKVRNEYFEQVRKEDIVDISFGSSGIKNDLVPWHYHRISLEQPCIPLRKILSTEYLYYILKMPLGKNTIGRK